MKDEIATPACRNVSFPQTKRHALRRAGTPFGLAMTTCAIGIFIAFALAQLPQFEALEIFFQGKTREAET